MSARRISSCLVLLGLFGCAAAADGQSPADSNEQALHSKPAATGSTQCRGRYYPVWKDNRTPQVPKDDVELIDTLVPHHQGAIMMADIEMQRGANAELKAMAEKMKSDQSEEIQALLRIREQLTGCGTVTRYADPGMDRDMQALQGASGAELDLLFIEHMIPHHAGALVFTHAALANLENAELETMAHEIIDAQAMEIGHLHMMKMMLEAGGSGGMMQCSTDADCGGSRCMAHCAPQM